MKTFRGQKFRLYPNKKVEARLLEWERSLKYVWNVGLQQRFQRLDRFGAGMNLDDPYCVSQGMYLQQQNQLPEARAEIDWLGDCPSTACQGVLRDLQTAWGHWIKKSQVTTARPRFKGRRVSVGMHLVVATKKLRLRKNAVKLPKIGWVKAVIHRDVDGTPKKLSVSREGGEWYVCIMYEMEFADPKHDKKRAVGVDRGVKVTLADSEGQMHRLPKRIKHLEKRVEKLQARYSQRVKFSNNWKKGKAHIRKIQKKIVRIRHHWLHLQSLNYAKAGGTVVVEDLKVKNMTKSAKGNAEEPGKNVKAKAGLNRSVLRQGWSTFLQMLSYKGEQYGTKVVQVPAAYTSQTCSQCGHRDKENRPSQSQFVCTSCGHEENADLNASKVILQRHLEGKSVPIGGFEEKKKPKKQMNVLKRKKKAQAAA